MIDKIGICKDGGECGRGGYCSDCRHIPTGICIDGRECGIGGYCDNCRYIHPETDLSGYPGIAHDLESARQRINEIEKKLARRDALLAAARRICDCDVPTQDLWDDLREAIREEQDGK